MHLVTLNVGLYKRNSSLSSRHRHSEESISNNIGQLVRDSVCHKAITQTALQTKLVFWTRRSYWPAIHIPYSFQATIELLFFVVIVLTTSTLSFCAILFISKIRKRQILHLTPALICVTVNIITIYQSTHVGTATNVLFYYPSSVTSGTEYSEEEHPSLNSSLANACHVLGKSVITIFILDFTRKYLSKSPKNQTLF